MPLHLKKSINEAHLENGIYEQIVTHLEKELGLNGLEAADELQVNTVSPPEFRWKLVVWLLWWFYKTVNKLMIDCPLLSLWYLYVF